MLVAICTKRNRLPVDNSSSPRGLFDFVNGVYYFDSATYTASQAISDTGQITANGLEINTSVSYPNAPSILASEVQDYFDAGQFSAVINFEATDGDVLLELQEWFSGDNVQVSWFQETEARDANNFDGSRSAKDIDNAFDPGVHKIAFTRINEKIRVSIDGFPIGDDGSFGDLFVTLPDPRDTQSDDEGMTTFPMHGFNNYHLGGVFTDGFNGPGDPQGGSVIIKSITFYDPVTDAQLVTLSGA